MDARKYTVDGSDETGWAVLGLSGELLAVYGCKQDAEKLVTEMNELKHIEDASGR